MDFSVALNTLVILGMLGLLVLVVGEDRRRW